jgi:HEAT repeat protein
MTENKAGQDNPVRSKKVSTETIKSLVADLGSKDGQVRARARLSLVAIGEPAVVPLVEALANPKEWVRWEAAKALGLINVPWHRHADPATIRALIVDLGSKDGMVRVRARKSLVAIGKPAVGSLVEALASKKELVRWEAAKSLGQIDDPTTTQALVKALEDDMFDVRWLAAEALIIIGKEALVPLLQALTQHSDSLWLREGAHHVFHDIEKARFEKIVQPVLAALEDVEPSLEVSYTAEKALEALAKK